MTRPKQSAASRSAEIEALDELIRANAPNLEPFEMRGIRAFGRWRYKYTSGREGDWFHVGLAGNKHYISLYVCPGNIAEQYRTKLPKADIGKSCIRFKRLADVDLDVIAAMIRDAAAAVGSA